MIITDLYSKEWKKLTAARAQPCLPYTTFDLKSELEAAKRAVFPALNAQVDCFYVNYGHLACICIDDETPTATIYFHQILNHIDTPVEIAAMICKHELLHLVIPPREVDGKMKMHPPEFWERERVISPERDLVWNWIWRNFFTCILPDKKREGIKVLPDWRKRWYLPRIPLSEFNAQNMTDSDCI